MRKRRFVLVAIALSMLAGLLVAAPVNAQDLIIADVPMMQNPAWYRFDVGRVEDENSTKVTISSREPSARFQIFTADKVDFWARPEPEDWFGVSSHRATANEEGEGARGSVWSGNLVPGAYYVRCSGGNSALGVSGQGVSRLVPVQRGTSANYVQAPADPEMIVADTHILNQANDPVSVSCGAWIENQGNCAKLRTFRVGRLRWAVHGNHYDAHQAIRRRRRVPGIHRWQRTIRMEDA